MNTVNSTSETWGGMRLLNVVIDRIGARRQLTSVAKAILAGLANDEQLSFVGEETRTGQCMNGEVGTELFVCNQSQFTCGDPTNFTCLSGSKGTVTHLCQNKTKDDYQCKYTETFKCQVGDTAQEMFDCMSFDCGDGEGTQEKFDCNATVDFMCGGLAHDCPYQFDCTAEHIHWCTNKDDCDVAFTCRGGNDCKEDHKCNGNYSIAEPEDDTPGDFMCGYGKLPSENDQFACKSTFACESYDDFSCRKLATFNCGDGEGTDNFNCTNERFVCRTVFNCSEIQKVDCGDPDEYRPTGGATYNLQPPE